MIPMRRVRLLLSAMALGLLTMAGPAHAGTVTLDFEALVNLQSTTAYLASYGITVTGADAGTALFAASELVTYGGGVVNAPSGVMYLTQGAANPDGSATGGAAAPPPNAFTLNFDTALTSFGFSDSAILAPSINSPWTATAYSGLGGTGSVLDTESYSPSATHPTAVFVLTGAGIQSVRFFQNPSPSAAFYSGNFDDFVLTGAGIGVSVPEPRSLALVVVGLLAMATVAVRSARRTGV